MPFYTLVILAYCCTKGIADPEKSFFCGMLMYYA